jgi:crotonobetainyl-CoA:carnitine CoA-transferase CaiB-like acyl-CoA transferase
MAAPVNQKNFEQLADAIGRPELKSDVRFKTPQAREKTWDTLMTLIEEWSCDRAAADCEEILMRAGVPCSRYKTVADQLVDQDLLSNGTYAEVTDRSGKFLVTNPPFKFSNASVEAEPWVADLGEHQNEILGDMLGISAAELTELASAGIIGRR